MVEAMKSELLVPVTRRGIINDALARVKRYADEHLKKHSDDAEELTCTMVVGIKGGSYVAIFVDGVLDLSPSIMNVDLEKVTKVYRILNEKSQSEVRKMDLKDTVDGMVDPDYKKRFIAEHWQLRIRVQRLESMIIKAEAGKLDFTPTCPIDILKGQLSAMQRYLHYMRVRALIEGIKLSEEEVK